MMQEASVPAAPPEKRLNSCILEAVMVRSATMVDPPRQLALPPLRILVVLLAPPSGIDSGVITLVDGALLMLLLLLHPLLD